MSNKIKQFVAFGVASVIALVLCIGVLVVTVNNLGDDKNITENKATIINKTELDSSKETLVAYFNKLVLKTDNRFVKIKTYTDVSFTDLKVLNSVNQAKDEALFNFAKDKMLSSVDGYYESDSEGTFKSDDSKKLSLSLNKNLLKNAAFSIGQVDENGEEIFDDEGNLIDNEYYFLIYKIDIDNELYNKKLCEMFSVKDDVSAKEQFIDAVKGNCRIENFETKTDSFTIKAKVNRENDTIEYINVIRRYTITLDAEFINDAEIFGEKEFSFVYTVTDTYEYSYAGVSFVEDEVTIEHNEEYMLNVNAIIDNDSEYTVEFISSDEDIASVDEMGYIKGLKNCDVPVTITVKLNYLGEIFTDTCSVYVSEDQGGAVNE